MPGGGQEQLALVRAQVRRASPRPPEPAAATDPVARVAVDVSLAHLDRLFDYEVPAGADEQAVPGVRVRVRFAGQLVSGYLIERAATSEHTGRLARLKVVSAEPVLSPQVARLAREVADHYAGALADVLRLAVPPRHAAAEAGVPAEPVLPPAAPDDPGPWRAYPAGPAFLRGLAAGRCPRAVWTATADWPAEVAHAVRTALAADRGALVVVPDHRDADRVAAAIEAECGPGQHVLLSAEAGPKERYRRWLAVRRGAVRAVVGTRAAMFAPVERLGLAVVWDDGDDLHAEPHAPYPHVREVLVARSQLEGAALLLGGHARTAEAQLLVETGWAHPVERTRADARAAAPLLRTTGDDAELARDPAARAARLPSLAWETLRTALRSGPALVQVPRRGYLPTLACTQCRNPARCPACAGPLALSSGHAVPRCRWCGKPAGAWRCPECDGVRLRAVTVGASRTAEELGRSFPGVRVRTSGGDGVLATVDAEPALVVATPGAEPVADGGYAAALLLDTWALLARPDLRAGEEALRRWLAAVALVRPAARGGRVVVLGDPSAAPVQALLRMDPAGAAAHELEQRRRLDFPPAVRLAVVSGPADAMEEFLAAARLPSSAAVLGPLPLEQGPPGQVRALLRAPLDDGAALSAALRATQAGRSARKAAEFVTVRVDPVALG